MKKISVLLAVVVFAAAGFAGQEAKILKVKVLEANLRADPDMASAVVKQVKLGALLEARQKIGDWYEVLFITDKGEAKSAFIPVNVVDVVGGGGAKEPAQTGPAAAVDLPVRWPGFMIFGRYGSFSPSDDIFKTIYGRGSVFGGEFRIHVTGGLYASLEACYFKKTGGLTATQEETTMAIYPIDVLAVFQALPGAVSPYIGAGAAICKYKEENFIGTTDQWGYGFAACAGVTVRWRSLGIDARIKYTSVNIEPYEVKSALGGLTLSLGAGVVY